MNFLERIKQKIYSTDLNAMLATIVSTLGSMTTADLIQVIYTLLSVFSAIWTIRVSYKKNRLEDEMKLVEIQIKREELREKQISNDLKTKSNESTN